MFSFDSVVFRYEPYPIGLAATVLEESLLDEMIQSYPPLELFAHLPKTGRKYSLSEKFNPRQYRDFVSSTSIWHRLQDWIKSPEFIDAVDSMLRRHHVDLGLDKRRASGPKVWGRMLTDLARVRLPRGPLRLRSRFEFSALPAAGGFVYPHTDAQKKLITLVVSMVKQGEWNQAWGGGTDVNRSRDPRYAFNWVNSNVPFEDVEVVHSYPFLPNQCVVFVKTFNSLHSVRPMTGADPKTMRKTLTINIEEDS